MNKFDKSIVDKLHEAVKVAECCDDLMYLANVRYNDGRGGQGDVCVEAAEILFRDAEAKINIHGRNP